MDVFLDNMSSITDVWASDVPFLEVSNRSEQKKKLKNKLNELAN